MNLRSYPLSTEELTSSDPLENITPAPADA